MIGARPTVVVAFDGLIADTLGARAEVVAGVLARSAIHVAPADIVEEMAGRSIVEAARVVASASEHSLDETALDIIGLKANRDWRERSQMAVALRNGAVSWLSATAGSARLVVRADSERAMVERVLQHAGLDSVVAFAVCSDDVPRTTAESSLLCAAWQLVRRRVGAAEYAPGVSGLECASQDLIASCNVPGITRITDLRQLPRIA